MTDEQNQSRITYRRVWRWWPYPHRETIGAFDLGSGGPITPAEIEQIANDLNRHEDE